MMKKYLHLQIIFIFKYKPISTKIYSIRTKIYVQINTIKLEGIGNSKSKFRSHQVCLTRCRQKYVCMYNIK